MMVTVATTLDVPIKLVFPGPKRDSMLGLGDVVLPGIMIALALRFDLYLHYLSLQRTIQPFSPALSPRTPLAGDLSAPTSTRTERARYSEASGRWGERFWTRHGPHSPTLSSTTPPLALHTSPTDTHRTVADGARFAKVYFRAGMAGYLLGMLVTIAIMHVFQHAQPALLYLVPSTLGALWGTAWLRGEAGEMWQYTEDGRVEEGEQAGPGTVSGGDANANGNGNANASNASNASQDVKAHDGKAQDGKATQNGKAHDGKASKDGELSTKTPHAHVLFISLTAPRSLARVKSKTSTSRALKSREATQS